MTTTSESKSAPSTPAQQREKFWRRLESPLPVSIRCRGFFIKSHGQPTSRIFPSAVTPGLFHNVHVYSYGRSNWNPSAIPVQRVALNVFSTKLSKTTEKLFDRVHKQSTSPWTMSPVHLELNCTISELPQFAGWLHDFIRAREHRGQMQLPPFRLERDLSAADLMQSNYLWTVAARARHEDLRSPERWELE